MSGLIVKETAGDTLTGIIDGANTSFDTSFDFDSTFVKVYFNGMLMQADLETGYDLIPPRTVVMKEAPLFSPDCPDTLEIEYKAVGIKTGGGALGGCPDAPKVCTVIPDMQACEDVPDLAAGDLEPTTLASEQEPSVLTGPELKPRMLGTEDC
jgi:hypothetical protein